MRDRDLSDSGTPETLAEREEIQGCYVDVIAGGFPCQDLSRASATASGLDGKRSGLWWGMLRIICLVRPKYIIVENVAAILDGERMGTLLGSMAAAGLDAEWDCLQAKEFGAPHERDRFFALAYSNEVNGETRMGDQFFGYKPHARVIEWMMGFPQDFTLIESGASEMPLCHKLPNGSEAE